MKGPTRRFVEPPVFVSQSSSWLTYMLFEEESSSRKGTPKGWRRGDEGRTAAYTRGIPNDFGSFGTARRDRGACRRGPKSRSAAKRNREGPERGPSRAQCFLRLTSARLAFYLGQTGIRLNALIKPLTSFGRPGGHRVSAGPRVGPFLPRLSVLPSIFVPPLRIATRTSRLTIGVSYDQRWSGCWSRI